MHPVLILVPAAALALGAEHWVQKVLRQYNSDGEDSFDLTGGELDASFRKALPLLREGYINREQEKAAKKILLASGLTYFASSLVGALSIWRWMPSPTGTGTPHPVPTPAPAPPAPGKAPRVGLAPVSAR